MKREVHITTSLEQEIVKEKIILSIYQGIHTHLEPTKRAVQRTK